MIIRNNRDILVFTSLDYMIDKQYTCIALTPFNVIFEQYGLGLTDLIFIRFLHAIKTE